MAEYLDQLLESLSTTEAMEPPAAFLQAVGRRRRRRRMALAGACAAVAALVITGVLMLNSPVAPAPGPARMAAAPPLPADSMLVLVRTNAHRGAEHLVLPDRAAPAGSEPLRLGLHWSLHWNPSQVDRWVGQ